MGLSISGIEMKRVLERRGWYLERNGASHWLLAHPDRPGQLVAVERHRSDIAIGTLRKVLKQTGLTEEDVRSSK